MKFTLFIAQSLGGPSNPHFCEIVGYESEICAALETYGIETALFKEWAEDPETHYFPFNDECGRIIAIIIPLMY